MMPLDLFANRCFSGLNLLTFLLYGAFAAAMLLIPYVLITSGGYSPVQAGLAMLPLPILMTRCRRRWAASLHASVRAFR